MITIIKNFIFGLITFTALGTTGLNAQEDIENLAFKILQKQAAEYETALSERISSNIAKYVPSDRFHLSVRIFWNPSQLKKFQNQNQEIRNKSGKLPGFQVFVRNEEQSLDYYLGAGSILKLKIEILLDEKLKDKYSDFIYQLVPVQARFVPERGDSVTVTPIPFPATAKGGKIPDEDVPLVADNATQAVVSSVQKGMKELSDLKPIILHPVLQRYVGEYEEFIKEKLTRLISEYVSKKNFLLDVKFFWNADEIDKLKNLAVQSDPNGKLKLPGFTIYLEERDALYKTIANSTTLMRMDISIMLDDTVDGDVTPFLKKLVPLAVKIQEKRGDRLMIYTGHFPRKGKIRKSGMNQKGGAAYSGVIESEDEILAAFESGEYRQGIILIDLQLSRTQNPKERIPLLKQKGSFHLMLQEKATAQEIWQEVQLMSPDDRETLELLEYLK
ncbi:MAG: hypothetical protein GY786_00945 [Proteobacteria bacterium]|nr:hypothetical protein [Pseudomonadota bacterium]